MPLRVRAAAASARKYAAYSSFFSSFFFCSVIKRRSGAHTHRRLCEFNFFNPPFGVEPESTFAEGGTAEKIREESQAALDAAAKAAAESAGAGSAAAAEAAAKAAPGSDLPDLPF